MSMIEKFLDYIKEEKRYSENTILSYRKDLNDFCQFLKDKEGHENMLTVDKRVIRNFIPKNFIR